MFTSRHPLRLAAIALALLLAAPAGRAGDDSHDHDRARQALEAGQILPLRTILQRVERDYPGQIMEVELEHKGERWYYEIKLLRERGELVKLLIDARDGRPLGLRDKAREHRHGGDR